LFEDKVASGLWPPTQTIRLSNVQIISMAALLRPWLDKTRSWLAMRFFIALRRATHRMPSSLVTPKAGRVLVIAPHFDDEAIGCGGAIARHVQAGSQVCVAFVTNSQGLDPNASVRAKVGHTRRQEALAAQAVLGYQHLECFDLQDGHVVKHEKQLSLRLKDLFERFAPDAVFCPFPADGHGDHQAVALATAW
jgi:hypothetical protein